MIVHVTPARRHHNKKYHVISFSVIFVMTRSATHASSQLSILQFITPSTSLPLSDLNRESEDRGDDCDPTILLSDSPSNSLMNPDSNVDIRVDTAADNPGLSVLTEDAGQLSTILNASMHDYANTPNPLLPLKFHPSSTYKFPKRKFGASRERSFKSNWCQKYQWLHYDASSDAVFCYLCMRADKKGKLLVSTRKEPAFISKGFTY